MQTPTFIFYFINIFLKQLLRMLEATAYHFYYYYFHLFIYFWLQWVFVAAQGLSLVAASRGYSPLWCTGFSLRWLLLLRNTGSRHTGFSSCGSRALERRLSSCGSQAQQLWLTGSRAQAWQLWHTGLVAPWHVGSSQTRAQTRVPCIARRILNHCATREVPVSFFHLFVLQYKNPGHRGFIHNSQKVGSDPSVHQ